MVLKKLKAISNSSRNTVLIDYKRTLIPSDKKTPKKLLQKLKVKSGRDVHSGSITIRHRKGGHKKFYRIIDFERKVNDNIEGKIKSIEYDPNRNAFISLVSYLNGDFRYILNPEGLTVGDKIISGDNENIPLTVGNCLPLGRILTNMPIHNIELKPGRGGQLARSAGTYAEIIGDDKNDDKRVLVKFNHPKTKTVLRILKTCRATIGKVGNSEINLVKLGKAGRNSWRGVRPAVRGTAMNAVDHPHGKGKGKSGVGRPSPRDPWGNKTLGKRTRNKNKAMKKYTTTVYK